MTPNLLTLLITMQLYGADATRLDNVVVTADPRELAEKDVYEPVQVLSGAELERKQAASIGETLAREPGVSASAFAPGASRPIIRGLDGARVRTLIGGMDSADVAVSSADHGVAIEPVLAEQIEVLRGPATLIFGPSAIGGVVNVVDGRVPSARLERPTGGLVLEGSDNAEQRLYAGRVDAPVGALMLNAQALVRDASSYDSADGEVDNSALETRSGSLGLAYVVDGGRIGLAVSRYESLYGIPAEEDEEEESIATQAKSGEGEVVLDLEQTRIDLVGVLQNPFSGAESLSLKLAASDYEHVELAADEVGTQFLSDSREARFDIVHGAIGRFTGAYGFSLHRRDLEAIGDEAFVPPSETQEFGIYLVERGDFAPFAVEFGARFDNVDLSANERESRDYSLVSLALTGAYEVREGLKLRVGLDRAQRAPGAEELYSDGPHEATGAFEIGDPDLKRETANQIELGVHRHGSGWHLQASAYYARFDGFTYLADTGEIEDDLPVRVWVQEDADFLGFEADLGLDLIGDAESDEALALRLTADAVRAELDDGSDLPRIPPLRFGAALEYRRTAFDAALGLTYVGEQDRVGEFETTTDSYTLVDLDAGYRFAFNDTSSARLYFKARNLADEEGRVHGSFLKDRAPIAGRTLALGVRFDF